MAATQSEVRQFSKGELSFTYTWQKKAVKNYNLRVKPGGEVTVSTPRHITEQQLERFLLEKAEFLRRALQRTKERASAPVLSLATGEQLPIWGIVHTVRHEIAPRPRAYCENGQLVLALPHPDDVPSRARLFARFAREECEKYLTKLTVELSPYALPTGQDAPKIGLRAMKSRWGSCFYREGRICYNTRLFFLPPALVQLVVLHELTHFRHHNHSAAFYADLGKLLPEHRRLRAALRTVQIPTFVWE